MRTWTVGVELSKYAAAAGVGFAGWCALRLLPFAAAPLGCISAVAILALIERSARRHALARSELARQLRELEVFATRADGVAHDFNNVLAVIGMSSGMLGETLSSTDLELVHDIDDAVTRATALTRQLHTARVGHAA